MRDPPYQQEGEASEDTGDHDMRHPSRTPTPSPAKLARKSHLHRPETNFAAGSPDTEPPKTGSPRSSTINNSYHGTPSAAGHKRQGSTDIVTPSTPKRRFLTSMQISSSPGKQIPRYKSGHQRTYESLEQQPSHDDEDSGLGPDIEDE